MPYAEPAYGDPESGQTVVKVINGKLIRLLVDDEPFEVRYVSATASVSRPIPCTRARKPPSQPAGRTPARPPMIIRAAVGR